MRETRMRWDGETGMDNGEEDRLDWTGMKRWAAHLQ
jgi:hypothetical protein